MNSESRQSAAGTNGQDNARKAKGAPVEDAVTSTIPIYEAQDGGYGWVVTAAAMMISVIVDGVCFSFGIFLIVYSTHFNESMQKTAWIGSLIPGMYSMTGPLASALANSFGCRAVCIVGSIIATIGFVLSAFATSVNFLIVTFGVITGIGFGLMYLPSIVIVGYYFDKKRAFATGIAVCGSGIGTLTFAPLAQYLITSYGWRITNWVFAAIILHGAVMGAFFRPLTKNTRKKAGELIEVVETEKDLNIPNLGLTPSTARRRRLGTYSSVDNSDQISRLTDNDAESLENKLQHKRLLQLQGEVAVLHGSQQSVANSTGAKETLSPELVQLYRKDRFYTGSITSLAQYSEAENLASYIASITNIPEDVQQSGKTKRIWNTTKNLVDFSIFKNLTFLTVCFANVLAMIGFFTPFIYITDFAVELGVPLGKAAFLISILGIFNTLGRIMSGWLSDRQWTDCLLIYNGSLIVSGALTCLLPFIRSYNLMIAYCIVFGLSIAPFISLRSIVLVDLLGLEMLSNSVGVLLLFQGAANLVGSPFAGWLYDVTNSYTVSFITSGLLIAVGGVICLPIRYLARWEAKRNGGGVQPTTN